MLRNKGALTKMAPIVQSAILLSYLSALSFPLLSLRTTTSSHEATLRNKPWGVSAHSWSLGQRGEWGGRAGGLTRCQGKSVPRFDYSHAFPPLHLHWAHPNGQLPPSWPPPPRAMAAKLFKGHPTLHFVQEGGCCCCCRVTVRFLIIQRAPWRKVRADWQTNGALNGCTLQIMTPKFGLFCRPAGITCVSSQFILSCQIMCKLKHILSTFSSFWHSELRRVLCSSVLLLKLLLRITSYIETFYSLVQMTEN